MRGLMAAVIGMGILIVVGVTVLVVVMVQRMSAPPTVNASAVDIMPGATSVTLADEPAGTRIAGCRAGGRPDGGAAGRRWAGPRGGGRCADRARAGADGVGTMSKAPKKADLPSKICAACGRPIHLAQEVEVELGRGAVLLGCVPEREPARRRATRWRASTLDLRIGLP